VLQFTWNYLKFNHNKNQFFAGVICSVLKLESPLLISETDL